MRAVTVALLLLVVFAAPGLSEVADDKLIVPGERVGIWTLQMTIRDFEATIGAPNTVRDLSNVPDTLPATLYFWPNGLVSGTRDRNRIEYLYMTPLAPGVDQFKTEKGIAYESNRQAVLDAYGRPTAITSPGPFMARLIYNESVWRYPPPSTV